MLHLLYQYTNLGIVLMMQPMLYRKNELERIDNTDV